MDIVEFVEKVLNLDLLDFQKKYLTEMYNIYKNDPDSFNKMTCRPSARFDVIPLFAIMFCLFNKVKESEEVKCKS